MCGIVGYVGDREAQAVLISGLKRLEYRGYDSAGIATMSQKHQVTLLRAKGKVAELEARLLDNKTDDKIGIGHTRWATHGEPSKRNAHPHNVGAIYLVHNGIIENYQELESMLKRHGYEMKSDTDSEVLAALIDYLYQQTKHFREAVQAALSMVVGAYGIAVVCQDNHDEVIVARRGSPLIVGLGEGETFIASDASALLGYTKQVVYLEDGEIGSCTRRGLELFDSQLQSADVAVETLEFDLEAIQKKGYDHFLLKEIHDQPETVRSTLGGRINLDPLRAQLGGINMTAAELREVENVLIIGCGTAYYAGLLSGYIAEQFTRGVTIHSEVASEFRYRASNLPKNTVALIVSQSGETADTLACLNELKRRGVKCIGVVNAVGSTIARAVDGGVYVHVGAEISVASTKAFTSQVAAMLIFFLMIAQAKGIDGAELHKYVTELSELPNEIEKVIEKHESEIKSIAKKYHDYQHAIYTGRDALYPIALEGALKLKEVSYIHAEGYASGELKHGPIALIDDNFFEVCYIQDNWLYEKSISNIKEINARGGHIFAMTNSFKKLPVESVVSISTKLDTLVPLLFNVLSQLFAYYVAVERGNNIDQPRNLAKSVTVE